MRVLHAAVRINKRSQAHRCSAAHRFPSASATRPSPNSLKGVFFVTLDRVLRALGTPNGILHGKTALAISNGSDALETPDAFPVAPDTPNGTPRALQIPIAPEKTFDCTMARQTAGVRPVALRIWRGCDREMAPQTVDGKLKVLGRTVDLERAQLTVGGSVMALGTAVVTGTALETALKP